MTPAVLLGSVGNALGSVDAVNVAGVVHSALADTLSGGDPLSIITNLGFPGALLILLITRKLVTGAELNRVVAERDKAQAELVALRVKMEDDVIPALTKLADTAVKAPARGRAR